MSIFLNKDNKVIVQGITGGEGTKHTALMLKAGTQVVGGVNARKAGTTVKHVDADGNGIEVYYETPRSEWYRQEKLFMHGDRPEVNFPGPWEKELQPDGVAAKS